MKTYGAGILFQSDKKIFLIRRADTGEWSVPGGMIEPGESPQDAARREVLEECGIDFSARIRPYTLIDGYVTYLADRSPEFTPKINEESSEWGWFAGDELPENLHPGLIKTLASEPLNEMGVARLIQSGELTSPQFFINMHLFCIRVTGTGVAFRTADNQFTFRDPGDYLSEKFLERCAGVPVIWLHPEKNTLDSEEFYRRVIGTLINGYATPDREVWGIARIYDDEAAELMAAQQLSTSPAVTYSETQSNTVKIEGEQVLIEDEPLLLDHVAVCEVGVWDKLKSPAGVKSTQNVTGETMGKEEFMKLFRECFAELRSEMADSSKKDAACDSQTEKDRRDERRGEDRYEREKSDAQSEKDLEDERRGEHRRDDKYSQDRKDRDDERRGMEKRDSQTEKDREDERRGEDRALGKYRQTEKDRGDERRGEERRDGEYHQTEKDREDERRGMERYWDKEKGDSQDRKDREDERRGEHRREGEYRQTEKDRRDESRADSRADSDYLRREIADLRSRLPEAISDSDREELADAQMKADSVFNSRGERAPSPLPGERPLAYRRRVLVKLQAASPEFKNVDITSISDSQLLGIAEKQIFADAQKHASAGIPEGQLREIRRTDMAGRTISTFQGDPGAAWAPFKSGKYLVSAFNTQA